MHRSHRAVLALGTMVALIAAACAGTTATTGPASGGAAATGAAGASAGAATTAPTTAGGTTKAACDLLTDAEIKQIAGLTVTEKTDTAADNILYDNFCRWSFEETAQQLDLAIVESGGAELLEGTIEFEGGAEEIPGLGDRAIRPEISRTLMALSGDVLLDLFSVYTADAVEVELMRAVLANLEE